MDYNLLGAFITFAFVSTITPGPNNIMLASSGANFGFQRTIPHMLGIGLGFSFMVILVGMGLIQVFDFYPTSYSILKAVSLAYLVYLAYKIATTQDAKENKAQTKPLSFLQAASFQWINPKAWTMALTAISVYAPSHSFNAIVLCAGIFALVNLPSVSFWTFMGQKSRQLLSNPARLRAFNIIMAGLLIASIYPLLF
ncbi:LysE family translocator [Shewanella surugensis]|uniref:LysE family translocator n=1 Tax=Shewanella surugensis TaxID=212020 RepID=A0ABT0LBQ1_9GAMM|nr:LysE family translocator [Shewanella surugensis]MCL1124611.1 LysE family translocator [Shewanella surugensis]